MLTLPSARAIKEQTHAQSLGPLGGHQPQLPSDMVDVIERSALRSWRENAG
jgi:hypothetical protein